MHQTRKTLQSKVQTLVMFARQTSRYTKQTGKQRLRMQCCVFFL